MLAAFNGHTEVAALLIERGADIQAKDNVRSPSFVVAVFFVHSFESFPSDGICFLLFLEVGINNKLLVDF